MINKSWPKWVLAILTMGIVAVLIILALVYFPPPPPASTNNSMTTAQIRGAASSPTVLPLPTQPTSISPDSPLATPTVKLPTSTPATSSVASALTFDGDTAYQHVLAQTQLGPRPTGTEAGWATGDLIITALEQVGWAVETQEFTFKGVKGRNIIGRLGSGPVIILGAHYDTRPAADKDPNLARQNDWIEGANDGASGVAVLLELARVLETNKLKNEVWLAFFDAEDRGRLDDWPFSVGARYMAENLVVKPQSVVVVDMIGDADQNIFFERNSTEDLSVEIWAVAAELGYENYLIPQFKHTIIDDHLPFLERGIPAVDMIDFDYPYWHTVADTADKVAPESLERVGRTLEVWLEEKLD
ncbi:MAG: hypothetical protein BroJett011_10130 [Chloroflexota bacterium]|nr:MAG: hypothetical protein BroJett011_10130 [Chloroflexota bacterium]